MSVRSEVIRIMNEILADSKKITELPAGSAPSGAELVEAVQNGANVKLTVSQLGGGSGATAFTQLTDVPASYVGQAGKVVSVNGAETALEFTTPSVGGGTWGSITGTLSNQTDLQTALNLKANLASPTFTGTPAAPTPAEGNNTTLIATTEFVTRANVGGDLYLYTTSF